MSVFGAVCLGRPMVLAQQLDQTKYVVTIPNASNVSYITIFILPNSPFVDINYTALVYFQLPSNNESASEYKLLGGINPSKPSAIYKLNNNSPHLAARSPDDIDMDSGPVDTTDNTTINIGLSIEPTSQAEQLIQNSKTNTGTTASTTAISKSPNSTADLANKIVGNAYNYLASFVDNSGKVPIKAFDNWWEKFKAKLNNNPNFLNELQD